MTDTKKNTREFSNGEELREALPSLPVGTRLIYMGVPHKVIDAGKEQGHRVAAIREPTAEAVLQDANREMFGDAADYHEAAGMDDIGANGVDR